MKFREKTSTLTQPQDAPDGPTDIFISPPKIPDTRGNTPEAGRYPLDIGVGQKAYMEFIRRDPVKLIGGEPAIKEVSRLYLPPTLKVAYGANYQEMGSTILRTIALFQGMKNMVTNIGGVLDATISDVKEVANKGLAIGGSTLDGLLGSNLGLQARIQSGVMINPHQVMAFDGVNFREFTFSFQLMARNKSETENIRNILRFFKQAAHPKIVSDESQRWLQLPDNFDIKMYSPVAGEYYMFQIKTSVLTSINIDFAGSGTPSFFIDGAPVDVRLDLTFRERAWLTRDDFEGDSNY